MGSNMSIASIAGISPAYGAAMAASESVFRASYGQGLAAAFGGNVTPGPINTLINSYLGPQLAGGGLSNLAGLLPNYAPGGAYSPFDYTFGAQTGGFDVEYGYGAGVMAANQGRGAYPSGYGPFLGFGSQNDGRFASAFPTSPFELQMGHHADPFFPGGVRGGAADLTAMLVAGFNYLAQQMPLGAQHYVMGGPIIEGLG